MGLRVAIDIGGGFVDLVAADDQTGATFWSKSQVTPADLSECVRSVFQRSGVDPAQVVQLLHGQTLVINAILQLIFFFANQFIPYHELVPGQFGQQQEIITNFPLFALTVCSEFLVGIVVGTYLSVCTTLLYFDIRIRKEGFDLEMAARPPAEPSAGPELAAGPQY